MPPQDNVTVGPSENRWLWIAAGCALVVIGAIVVEVVSGQWANSDAPWWGSLAPLAWPTGVRVLWWCVVAVAAGGFRLALARLGIRQHPVVIVASVLPFLVFAAGIALGSAWAAWH